MSPLSRALCFALPATAILSACGAADSPAAKERVETARAAQASDGELTIGDAVVRLNANPEAPSAAYFTVTGGELPATITGVQSADVERAELHESMEHDGMMHMNAVTDVDVPAGGTVRFRQGGLHVMLFGVSDAARSARRLTLSIAFADGTSRDVEAPVLSATDPLPAAPAR